MTLVLVIDDIRAMAEQYAYDLKRVGGYDTIVAGGGKEGLGVIESEAVDCVVLDLEMPGIDGFEVLRTLRGRGVEIPVIVYTGTGNYDRCIQAIGLGATGFIDKAEPMERVVREVENALERRRLTAEVASLRGRLGSDTTMVGSSEAMKRLHDAVARVAPIPSPVLITGESGSGKELVARDLDRFGRPEKSPFVAVNCAALPENLVESELFGHERGAFTGANAMRKGAFEAAQDGTLFLDEVGELPQPAQAKLLRVLEQNELSRVGGNRTIPVMARVVAATNRDLEAEVERGGFREDLLYRLNVHVIAVPPLRDRAADIPELAGHFLRTICARIGTREKTLAPEALAALTGHEWRRNNVRELRNIVERMIIAAAGDVIGIEHVPPDIVAAGGEAGPSGSTLAERKAAAEKAIVLEALVRNGWHLTNAAAELGLADHSSLSKVMRRHGIKRPSR